MFKYFRKKGKKGQSTLEYAILVIIIIGALLSIQVYVKRAAQGGIKKSADDIGDQYSPGNTNVYKQTKTHSKSRDTFELGESISNLVDKETTNVTGSTNILNVTQEFWGN